MQVLKSEELEATDVNEDRMFTFEECPGIETTQLEPHKLWNEERIDIESVRKHLKNQGRLSEKSVEQILETVNEIFKNEKNIVRVNSPVVLFGDIHGQFYDLLTAIEIAEKSEEFKNKIFLGDYVDRGCFSCECIFFMFCMKINFPNSFFMLRGNHETRKMTEHFNFKDECLYKYNEGVYKNIMEVFDNLPLVGLVDDNFFCLHGGLSPDIKKVENIEDIDRNTEVPSRGLFCDLLWSDPQPSQFELLFEKEEFMYNKLRRCSYLFGKRAVEKFLKANHLKGIIRAHEVQKEGYKFQMHDENNFPSVITIFSAPNYCDAYGNKGGLLFIKGEKIKIRQFEKTRHPYYLPNFMNLFAWSLPFVAEQGIGMLKTILTYKKKNIVQDMTNLRKKVAAVSAVLSVYKTIRNENELILKLKQLSPNSKLPYGLLSKGKKGIISAIDSFEKAKEEDSCNEGMPEEEK